MLSATQCSVWGEIENGKSQQMLLERLYGPVDRNRYGRC
jgi:hypothetical protein